MSRIAQPETYSNENSPWKHITTTCYKEMYFHLLESKKLVFANSYDLKYIPLLRISPVWLAGHSQGLSLYLVFLTNCPTNNISFVYLQSEITCRTYFGSKSLKISKRCWKKTFYLTVTYRHEKELENACESLGYGWNLEISCRSLKDVAKHSSHSSLQENTDL